MKRKFRIILGALLVLALLMLPASSFACRSSKAVAAPKLSLSLDYSSIVNRARNSEMSLADVLYEEVYKQLKGQVSSRYMEQVVEQLARKVVDMLLPSLEKLVPVPPVPEKPIPEKPEPPAPEPPLPEPPEEEPEPPADPSFSLSQEEAAMLELVNRERRQAGLRPLEIHEELTKLARIKARDMIENNYFSHYSPIHGSPFQMMAKAGIRYRYAGENLAGASTVERAHSSLMNSPGHRANILNPNFTHIGIGIVDGGPYRKMFVQMFINPL